MSEQLLIEVVTYNDEAKSTADGRSKGVLCEERKETSERRELKSRTRTGGNVESSNCGTPRSQIHPPTVFHMLVM